MIIDRIENSQRLVALHPAFEKVFTFLRTRDLQALPVGRMDLDGDIVYLKVEEPQTRSREAARLERHERYIDIQLPLVGTESYGWTPLQTLPVPETPYHAEADCAFYQAPFSVLFSLEPGEFAIFFPEDAHAPCIGEGYLRKIVVKVKL